MTITPHHDRFTTWRPSPNIAGWRDGWHKRLVANCPKCYAGGAARAGYLAALYALRAETMPAAYQRDSATADFQQQIEWAIAQIDAD